MKITFVVTDFPAYSQTFIIQQIKNALDAGHDLHILAGRNPEQQFVQPIYNKYRMGEISKYYNDNIFDENSPLTDLKKVIETDTDLFHCHFLPTGVALFRLMKELKIEKKILISCYGVDVMTRTQKNELAYLNEHHVSFIAVSRAIKEKMIFLGIKAEKIWIIPLTVDTDYFKKTKKTKNRITRFVSVCRLVEKKGLSSSIKALYSLVLSEPELKFKYEIYGDGPELEYLRKLISEYNLKDRVTINPPIDHVKILDVFKKSDFLIQTSRTAANGDAEGLPTVILEAQASGLPIIGTYHSGIPEEVADKKTGFLSIEDDIYDIAQNLQKAIRLKRQDFALMSKNARRLMTNRFSDQAIKKQILNLYEEKPIGQNGTSQLSFQPNKIRLLIFNHSAGLGGSERSLMEMVRELQKLGVICRVVLPYEDKLCREFQKMAVEYNIIGYHWWCSQEKLEGAEKDRRMVESFNNLMESKDLLDRWNPDIIFTNTLTIPWGNLYAQMENKPHITFIREFGDLDFAFDFFYGYKQSLEFIGRYSNYVFTNSKTTLDHFQHYIDNKKLDYSYAYIHIDNNQIKSKAKKIFLNNKSLKLVISGAVIETKGHVEAVTAVSKLVAKKHDIELVVIGPTYKQEYVNKLKSIISKNHAEKNIRFVDFAYNPFPLVNQADVVLVCSKNEAYGRVTIEALILGKPIIATRSGANPEFVTDRKNGYLYIPGNADDLTKKIAYLYDHRDKIITLGKKGYNFYRKTFKETDYGEKIYEIMKKVKNLSMKDNSLVSTLIRSYNKTSKNGNVKIEQKDKELDELKKKLEEQQIKNEEVNGKLLNLEKESVSLKNDLAKIHASKMWRLLYFYKKMTNLFKKK